MAPFKAGILKGQEELTLRRRVVANQLEAGCFGHRIAGEVDGLAIEGPVARALLVDRAVGQGITEVMVGLELQPPPRLPSDGSRTCRRAKSSGQAQQRAGAPRPASYRSEQSAGCAQVGADEDGIVAHGITSGRSLCPATAGAQGRPKVGVITCRQMSIPTNASGAFPRLTSSSTLERPALRAASTAATTCAGVVTGWLLTDMIEVAALQALLAGIAVRIDRGDDHAARASPAGWPRARAPASAVRATGRAPSAARPARRWAVPRVVRRRRR